MKKVIFLLILYYLGAEASKCKFCTKLIDWPVCGFNQRCYTVFRNSCEMEMTNCHLPGEYKFQEVKTFGLCVRPGIKKCKGHVLKEKLESVNADQVEIFS